MGTMETRQRRREKGKEMSKFTVKVEMIDEQNFTGRITVSNRAGRTWASKSVQDYGNAEEGAMVLREMLDGGEKLNRDHWVEV
jgi:hypothetical protein